METRNTSPRNVLIGVDIQNDFITGSLAVKDGEQIVAPTNQVAQAVRATGGDIAFTRDWHPAETPHFNTQGGLWPEHCVAETEGAAFAPNLDIQATDLIISKGMGQTDGYSGWEGVGENKETLETIITPRTPDETVRVFLGGLATDYCVKATGLDIANFFKGDTRITTYLLRDAVRAVALDAADEANALKALKAAQILAISTEEALAMIQGAR